MRIHQLREDSAYTGTPVDGEAKAVRGLDPTSRVGTRETQVGTCGSAGFCGAQAYACYTCCHFQPWLDAPHHNVLKWLVKRSWPTGFIHPVEMKVGRLG